MAQDVSAGGASVLVTGASGFLGGHLARALVARGDRVRVLVRPSSDVRALEGLSLERVSGDLSQPETLRRALVGIEVVYHCAALSADWGDPRAFQAANVDGVQALVEAALATATLRRFVHVSSSDVYGYPVVAADESAPLVRRGLPYNESKIGGEEVVWRAIREKGLQATIVRPATIYGPRCLSTVGEVALLLEKGEMVHVSGGRASAGLIYVADVVDVLIRAAHAEVAVGKAYNLAHPEPVTWRKYTEALAEGIGAARPKLSIPFAVAWAVAVVSELWTKLRGRGRPLLTRHSVCLLGKPQTLPTRRVEAELGFVPATEFDEGMAQTCRWWREEGRAQLAAVEASRGVVTRPQIVEGVSK